MWAWLDGIGHRQSIAGLRCPKSASYYYGGVKRRITACLRHNQPVEIDGHASNSVHSCADTCTESSAFMCMNLRLHAYLSDERPLGVHILIERPRNTYDPARHRWEPAGMHRTVYIHVLTHALNQVHLCVCQCMCTCLSDVHTRITVELRWNHDDYGDYGVLRRNFMTNYGVYRNPGL